MCKIIARTIANVSNKEFGRSEIFSPRCLKLRSEFVLTPFQAVQSRLFPTVALQRMQNRWGTRILLSVPVLKELS